MTNDPDVANQPGATERHKHIREYGLAGEYQQAIDECNQALTDDPEDTWAICFRGWAHDRLQQYQKALADYSEALILQPKYGDIYAHRGNIYERLGHFQEALADYDKEVSLTFDSRAYLNRSRVRVALGQFDQAIDDLFLAANYNRVFVIVVTVLTTLDIAFLLHNAITDSTPLFAIILGWLVLLPLLWCTATVLLYKLWMKWTLKILELIRHRKALCGQATSVQMAFSRMTVSFPLLRLLLPHALLNRSLYFHNRRRYKDCVPLAKERLEWYRKENCSEEMASAASWLGTLYGRVGDMQAAESVSDNACVVLKRAYDSDRSKFGLYCSALIQKTMILVTLRRFPEAIEAALQAQSIRDLNKGSEGRVSVTDFLVFGNLYSKTGKLDEAESSYASAVDAAKAQATVTNKSLATALDGLGYLNILKGNLEKANQFIDEAWVVTKQINEDDVGGTSRLLKDTGLLRMKQERYEEAEQSFKMALAEISEHQQADHPGQLDTLEFYRELLQIQGRDAEADQLTKRIDEISRKHKIGC